MGWVITSARKNVKDDTSNKYRLLSLMVCQEKDVSDDYIKTRYDLTMLLRNIGGSGGLGLVADGFFDWGMTAMRVVSKELTVEDITKKGEKAFAQAKKAILNNVRLKSDFALLCQRQQERDQNLKTNYAMSIEVYNAVMEKSCNPRFNDIVDNYVAAPYRCLFFN